MVESFPLLHDPPGPDQRSRWFFKIPIVGWIAGYAQQVKVEKALVEQAIDRGPVPESTWSPYPYDVAIRRKIEAIVVDHAYPKGSTFHPLDPVELMFVLRYGDLNEVEILLAIESQLGFKVDDDLAARLIEEHTTFVDFIAMIDSATTDH
ncbi:MAG: hypothetical protein HZC36_09415 [Armatimonadetes bacterium]|nr:hypothetical protein [Armatimonadota bacterium]